MWKRTTVGVTALVLAVGLLVSVLEAQRPVPRPRGPSPVPAQPSQEPPLENQQTRLQIEVFQLDGSGADLAKLDLDKVAAGQPQEVLSRLSELGQARLLHRLDTRFNFGRQIRIKVGDRTPVVQSVTVTKEGRPTPSVSYQDTGLSLSLSGSWFELEEETLADVNCQLEWSSIAPTGVQIGEGVKLPSFGQFEFDQLLRLQSGQPVAFLASQQPVPDDEEDSVTTGLVRLTLIHPTD